MAPVETRKLLLLHFSGAESAGILADIASLLDHHHAEILDISQAAVHESLSLGILCALAASDNWNSLHSELAAHAGDRGLQMQLKEVSSDEVERWMQGLSRDHFIVTLLGRSITARQLASVDGILAAHAMTVERIERLSGQLSPGECPANACVELSISGEASREAEMRAQFLLAAQDLSIDIAFQRESIFRRNRRLFAFDMDSTLIQGEVIDELAKMAGVADRVVRITEAAMRGEIDFDESFTRRVGLLQGLAAERVYQLLDAIPLAEGAERLIQTLRLLGYKTAILSGGFTFFARNLQQRLGIDFIHANELEIVDGKVTGRVIPPINNGARKAALLTEIAARERISLDQVVAVGDGANDIPMLNLAGMGIAYRAKPLVRQKAGHSVSCLGLDGLLYLIGVRDRDLQQHAAEQSPA